MISKINFKKGFTLLEALVAISILMVAVVSPITIAQKGLSSASYSKNQMIASYLAQDAIEYVKNVRDNNKRARIGWLEGFNPFCTSSDGCQIDTISGVFSSYINRPLLLDDNGFYGYTDTIDTNFTRQIMIKENPYGDNSDEAMVTVKVSWGTDNVEVKTLIYNYPI